MTSLAGAAGTVVRRAAVAAAASSNSNRPLCGGRARWGPPSRIRTAKTARRSLAIICHNPRSAWLDQGPMRPAVSGDVADELVDCRYQKLSVDRLGQEGLGAQGNGLGPDVRIVMAADHDHRRLRSDPAQMTLDIEAIHAFHVQIEDDAIRPEAMDSSKKFCPRSIGLSLEGKGA